MSISWWRPLKAWIKRMRASELSEKGWELQSLVRHSCGILHFGTYFKNCVVFFLLLVSLDTIFLSFRIIMMKVCTQQACSSQLYFQYFLAVFFSEFNQLKYHIRKRQFIIFTGFLRPGWKLLGSFALLVRELSWTHGCANTSYDVLTVLVWSNSQRDKERALKVCGFFEGI